MRGSSIGIVAAAVLALMALASPNAVVAHPLTPIRLQQLVDTTPAGGTLDLPPGWYVGPVRIDRPMTLRGGEGVIVDGRGTGTVVTVAADDVTLTGLLVRRSGDRVDDVDSGIRVLGLRVRIEDVAVEDCLYGIDLRQAHDAVVRRNRISSKDVAEQSRGDGIRVWYSNRGLFEGNDISDVRDGFSVEADGDRLVGNTVRRSRYGALLLYSHAVEIASNRFLDDAVGMMLIWADGVVIDGNAVRAARDIAGQALVMKESSGARVVGNDFFASAEGVRLDGSPKDPEDENLFYGNRFTFDGVAVTFHSDLAGDRFEANVFAGNHADLVVRGGGTALRAIWRGNVWDAWEGFDRDRDGVGDTPHEVWSWADRLWMDVPEAQLFRGTPALSALDFVERLAPFTQPRLLMRDETPAVNAAAATLPPSPNPPRSR